MHESDIADGDRPGIKPLVATPATPGPQQSGADDVVLQTSPARTAGSVAMTYRAKQFYFSPGFLRAPNFLRKGYVKADAQGKFHLWPDIAPCTIILALWSARIPVNSAKFPEDGRGEAWRITRTSTREPALRSSCRVLKHGPISFPATRS